MTREIIETGDLAGWTRWRREPDGRFASMLGEFYFREAAGRATTVGTLQIVFAAVWGAAFLGEVPTPLAFGGAALVAAGVVLASRARPAVVTES